MAQVRTFEQRTCGRLLLRNSAGQVIFAGRISEASMTESRDLGGNQMDFEIKLERSENVPVGNAEIWAQIEEIERQHAGRCVTFRDFISRRNALVQQLQGPINKERLMAVPGVIFDESSDLSHYRDAKRAMFGALYGGGGIALKQWANTAQKLTIAKHAALVGTFNETTPGGASRRNYLFDLEDRW